MRGEIALTVDPLDRKPRCPGEIHAGIAEPGLAGRDDMRFPVGEQGLAAAVDGIGEERIQLWREPLVDLLEQIVAGAIA